MTDWTAKVEEHGPHVWRVVCRLLHNPADAEECFQETFLAAWKVARREEIGNWGGLMIRLATNKALDRLRQRTRERGRLETGGDPHRLATTEPGPAQIAQGRELAEHLRSLLAELPPREAQVFCLRGLEEMSYEAIGQELGISVTAVSTLLHKARRRLQPMMEVERRSRHD